jgi:serine/threonine-protein kinase
MQAPVWEKIQQLFEAASELPPGTREAWLENACDGDRTLYLQVHSLLLAHEDDDGTLEREVASWAAQVPAPAPLSRVGPWRILSEIGSGGMGAVYLAERADGDYERKVAIKVIRGGVAAGPGLVRRFQAERRILAGLQHPNIARMLDGGVTDDGVPYLAMEYVEGIRIDEYCARNRLSLRQRLELFRQVCSAVEYAHRNLVVHRDIKPSNILVPADGIPKLLDFGIARLSHPDDTADEITVTAFAERAMTPEYASPEQIQGQALTTTTDVYSLGMVLYELLAGERPYRRAQSDPVSLLRRICEEEPVRPSEAASRSMPSFAANLRGDLDQIVTMAIRKEPLARYRSVELLSEDVGNYLDGYPVTARRGNRRYRAAKFTRRHWLALTAATVIFGLIVAFAATVAVQNARVIRERDIARRERAVSERVSGFLNSLFQASDPFLNNGAQLTARQLLDKGADRIAKELAGEPEVRAELLETVGQAYKHMGVLDQAERMFREKVRAVDQAYGPGSVQAIRILRQLGDTERMRDRPADAERDLRQALAFAERLPAGQDYELAQTLNNLALVETAKGDNVHALEHARRAVAIIGRYPDDPAEGLTMRSNLGSILYNEGHAAEAETILRKVLDGRRRLLGENHPQVLTSMRRLANVVAKRGAYAEAERLHRDAAARLSRMPGNHAADVLMTNYFIAEILTAEGRYSEAEAVAGPPLEKIPGGLEASAASGIVGWTLFLEGKTAQSDKALELSLRNIRAKAGAGTVSEARVLTRRSYVLSVLGRRDEGQNSAEAALAIYERPSQSKRDGGDAFAAVAWLSRLRGANDRAAALYGQALAADRSLPEPDRLALASHLLAEADFAAAEAPARESLDIRKHLLPEGFWAIDLSRLVVAEVSGDIKRAETDLADLRRKLGEGAMLSRAATERAGHRNPSLPVF